MNDKICSSANSMYNENKAYNHSTDISTTNISTTDVRLDVGLDMVLKKDEKYEKGCEIRETIEKRGKELIKKNEFFNDLSEIMTDDKFTKFFDKYFKNSLDIKTTVVYMKLYNEIKEKYKELTDDELSKYVNIYLLHHAMTNDNIRKTVLNATIEHLEDNRVPILGTANKKVKNKSKKNKNRKLDKINIKIDKIEELRLPSIN